VAKRGPKPNLKKRAEVLKLLKAGWSTSAITRQLKTGKKLVRSIARAHSDEVPEHKIGRPRDYEREARMAEMLRAGTSVLQVARSVGVSESTVRKLIDQNGGMLPPPSKRSELRLSIEEREEISRCLVNKWKIRRIARHLNRAPSTISREVNNNGGPEHYRAWAAEGRCRQQAKRPKQAKLVRWPELEAEVTKRLEKKHSPRQIELCLMDEFPGQPDMHISHEAIYQSLFIQGRGGLRRELTKCLRTGRALRRAQKREAKVGKIKDMVMISERPAEVEDRAVPGHWEGDLIEGAYGRTHIGTLVERNTRYVMLMKLEDKSAETVRKALEKTVKRLPEELFKSLTWDQGKEMADHATFSFNTDIDVYFCDPHSPWQRGSNENTNGLLRQYFPKGTDLSLFSQDELDSVARELNERPRETLGLKTPADMLNEVIVALTD
jgi:IS30 family transposase